MSRYFFLVISILFFTVHTFADCASSGVYVYPKSGEIHQNSLIIIEAYANSKEMVNQFGENYSVKLISDNHEVQLNRLENYTGMMHLYKIVFKPESSLKLNETYELVVEGLDKSHHDYPKYYHSKSKSQKFYSYKVTKSTDTSAPQWKNIPAHKENSQTFFGCGPAISAIFKMELKNKNEGYIKTELYNKSSGKSHTYILNLEKGAFLSVGHGMCSGAFTYIQGNEYKIRFKAYDLCGNTNNKWTDWINFDNPAPVLNR